MRGRAQSLDVGDIRRRYLSGESGNDIARSLETSKHTIYRRLAGQGVALRPSGRLRLPVDEDAVASMYKEGLSTAEIGRRVGCHRPTVVRLLRKAGVYEKGRRRGPATGDAGPPGPDPATVPCAKTRRRKA